MELDTLKAFAPANMGKPSRKTANAMPHTATDRQSVGMEAHNATISVVMKTLFAFYAVSLTI